MPHWDVLCLLLLLFDASLTGRAVQAAVLVQLEAGHELGALQTSCFLLYFGTGVILLLNQGVFESQYCWFFLFSRCRNSVFCS